jgi:hypothetical protein
VRKRVRQAQSRDMRSREKMKGDEGRGIGKEAVSTRKPNGRSEKRRKEKVRRTFPSGISLTFLYTFWLKSDLNPSPCTFPASSWSSSASSSSRSSSSASLGCSGKPEEEGAAEEAARARVRGVRMAGMVGSKEGRSEDGMGGRGGESGEEKKRAGKAREEVIASLEGLENATGSVRRS